MANQQRLKKRREAPNDAVRMTFEVDWHTSRLIKDRAKQSPYYLPAFIAKLVQRGLADARPIK